MEIYSHKRNWTCHLAIESSTVVAKASVAFLYGYFCHYFHVSTFTTSCHPVHNEDYRYVLLVWCIFIFVDPVKSYMPSICEKNLFALVLGNYVLREKFVDGLYGVVEEKRRRLVDVGRWWLGFFWEKREGFEVIVEISESFGYQHNYNNVC
jgi:hypothetical protein